MPLGPGQALQLWPKLDTGKGQPSTQRLVCLRQRDTKLLLGPQALSHRVGAMDLWVPCSKYRSISWGKGKEPQDWTGLDRIASLST